MMEKHYSCLVLGNIMLYGTATFVRVTLWRMWYNYGRTKIFFGFPFDADIRTRFSQTITATQRTVLKHTQTLRTRECGAEVITSYSTCDERVSMGHWWNKNDWGKLKVLGDKTCPSATPSTTNPTRIRPGLNLGLRGDRPASNCFKTCKLTIKTTVTF